MTQRQFLAVLAVFFSSLMALSVLWEFWLEDLLGMYLIAGSVPESLPTRIEFVVSVAIFSFLALLGPAWIGGRLIRRGEALQAEIERLSREDDLTGLYNRRQLTELLKQEIRRFERYLEPFVLISLDLDFFKCVNDRLGHGEGDRALVAVAGVLRSAIRAADAVGRWGGEEFMIICPATTLEGGLQLAEKVRRRVAEFDFERAGRITVSLGVAEFGAGDDLERIVLRADQNLYAAKGKGRNRVEGA